MRIIKSTYLLLFFLTPCLCLYSQFTLTDSLVAHYPLDGDALDISGNENHGTIIGAVLAEDRFGNAGGAYQFDGTNDYVSITPNRKFKPQLPVTIAAWVYKDRDKPSSVFRNDYVVDLYSGVWLNIPNLGRVEVAYGGNGPPGPGSRRSKIGETKIEAGAWYHVAGVIRGPRDMEVYVNGVNDCGTYSGSGAPLYYTDNDGTIALTDDQLGPEELAYFQGRIDDVRFYNRELSPQEIAILAEYTPPMLSIDTKVTICEGDQFQVAVEGGVLNQTYRWVPATGLSCDDCPNPMLSPTTTTTYQVIVAASSCVSDTLLLEVEVDPCIDCEAIELQTFFSIASSGLTATIESNRSSTVFDQAIIDWGDGVQDTLNELTSISHDYAEEGAYRLCLELFGGSNLGLTCVDTVCVNLVLEAPPDIDCDSVELQTIFSITNEELTATINPTRSSTEFDRAIIRWGDGAQDTLNELRSISHDYVEEGVYELCMELFGGSNLGLICMDTICVGFELVASPAPCNDDLFIPNVFSPNGDGVNDEFTIRYTCPLGAVNLKLFDRWGRQIAEYNSLEDRWDGKYKGKEMSEGVYYWVFQYQQGGERKLEKGSLTLIR